VKKKAITRFWILREALDFVVKVVGFWRGFVYGRYYYWKRIVGLVLSSES